MSRSMLIIPRSAVNINELGILADTVGGKFRRSRRHIAMTPKDWRVFRLRVKRSRASLFAGDSLWEVPISQTPTDTQDAEILSS